ncbi:oxidoreductase [Streptomyces lunaelactis]|uniref:Oxidoreductase n=1 Tax=Streptomyces lunaelactis TaxID=1535768 RepID=A0A2R4SWE0_9ACTN|nr:zinc-binding alcohol dehydrogenase family protein [Streptomyces lunaelactis]AVZ71190.1 oxidoreductase [Streptomyces lunaelactis]NUK22883.1 zinc-binding alcohol dehydrogenase family protein [Streptomyces lunaelactis]NUK86079.1 zinc-binding alcohol dehydrogenase family protein [Streptomyces lunaelactis]
MKAVVLDTDDHYRITELDEPTPGPGQVAIRVAYAGIQWGDTLVRDGHFAVPRPFVPGFEASGHIVAVGAGIDARRVSEAVTALTTSGAYAEVVLAPATLTLSIGSMPLRTAAGLGWGAPTAYDLINTAAHVRPGESVLIHAAAGSVGTLAAQFARLAGAGRIVGVVSTTDRADYAAQFGYDQLLLREEFPAKLDGEKPDVILDPVGGSTRTAGLEQLAAHGRLVAYGNLATYEPVLANANDLLMFGKSLLTYNSNLLSQTHPERLTDSARRALGLVADGKVRMDITTEYALEDLAMAVQRLAEGTTHGKSILRVA